MFFKFIISILILVLLIRKKLNLGIALIIDAIIVGLLFNMGLKKTALAIVGGAISWQTLELTGILTLILFLENIMRKNLFMDKMLNALKNLVGDYRIVAAMIPPFIGFLPSAGGALFSAPLVQEAIGKNRLSPERKAFINYWYRHIWEYVFPLYPAVILAARIIDVELSAFVKTMIPFTLIALLLGIPFGFYNAPKNDGDKQNNQFRIHYLKDFLIGISPIMFVLIMFFVFGVNLFMGLFVTVVGLTVFFRYTLEDYKKLLTEAFSPKILVLVFGVMIFKNTLTVSGSVQRIPAAMMSIDIPVEFMFFLLPFTIGALTGLSLASVAATFPILIGLLPEMDLSLMAFAYVSGFAGVMITPIHLCMIFSAEFFKARLNRIVVRVLIPEIILIVFAFLRTIN